ncbi:DUF7262 family protein [Halocatena halophila]|uniref:DUF7262 family protein n=1 Tax=Halocatena halophila TaxID=2814576 RepID=UPI002ED0558F
MGNPRADDRGQLSLSLIELAIGVMLIVGAIAFIGGDGFVANDQRRQSTQFAGDTSVLFTSPYLMDSPTNATERINRNDAIPIAIELRRSVRPNRTADSRVQVGIWTAHGSQTIEVWTS